jgi:serine/threonine-protein kinase
MQPQAGTTFGGRYRLERQLGAGASSTVWRAFDTVLERRVAIKVLVHGLSGESGPLERFRREARALAKLGHPNIVTVIDTGEDDSTPFIVLAYVGGETLKQRIRRDGRLAVGDALAYTIEVAGALAAAHDRGIVHRDVKSQNILIDPDGGAKLTDFGIARSGDDDALTQDGRVLGTTDYVSPEQALGHEVTGQSDLYSLGVVLYESLTGAVPFRDPSPVAVARMHVRAEIPDVQRARPEISAALAAVLERATAKHLKRRYQDAPTMIGDLEQALAIETARSGSASSEASAVLRALPPDARSQVPLRVRHPSSTALSLAAVALVAAALAVLIFTRVHTGGGSGLSVGAVEVPVSLAGASASAYDPFGRGPEDAGGARHVLDDKPGTSWTTKRYAGGLINTHGVGIYITAKRPLAASELLLETPTPGFNVQVWGATALAAYRRGSPKLLAALGWRLLGQASRVAALEPITLADPRQRFRYYLVWITLLHPASPGAWASAEISQLALDQQTGS